MSEFDDKRKRWIRQSITNARKFLEAADKSIDSDKIIASGMSCLERASLHIQKAFALMEGTFPLEYDEQDNPD